jgi:predicted NBD/HSP70 family sugar kinase
LQRARQAEWSGEAPRDVADLFARASAGDPVARDLVWDEGVRIGIGLVAARTVIDPRLVVLGGGIGRNELLVEPVRDTGQKLFPIPCDVVTTQLADRGSLIGAVTMAADLAWQHVLSDPVCAPHPGATRSVSDLAGH